VRALAGIGDVRGLEVLIDALSTDIGPSVRRAAARGLGTLRLEDPDVKDRGDALERCLEALQAGCEDGEWIVRYAVAVGMESLGLGMVETDAQRCRILNAMARLASIPQEPTSGGEDARLSCQEPPDQSLGDGMTAAANSADTDPRPTRVLFVCLGNICRSPAAEGVFLHLLAQRGLQDSFTVDSAGTGGWHVGKPADARMRRAAERRGIQLHSRARQVEVADLQEFDHILTMDDDNLHSPCVSCQRTSRSGPGSNP
jgi:protein-tyrosine-phosphatase